MGQEWDIFVPIPYFLSPNYNQASIVKERGAGNTTPISPWGTGQTGVSTCPPEPPRSLGSREEKVCVQRTRRNGAEPFFTWLFLHGHMFKSGCVRPSCARSVVFYACWRFYMTLGLNLEETR